MNCKSMMMGCLLVAMMAVSGCGSKGPEDVTLDLLRAIQSGKADEKYLKSHCTEDGLRAAGLMSFFGASLKDASFKVVESGIEADESIVLVEINGAGFDKGHVEKFALVKREGEWKFDWQPDRLNAAEKKKIAATMAKTAATKGRSLFVSIIQTNTEREAAGLPDVWPKTGDSLNGDTDDIAGVAFDSANAYFEVLYDRKRKNTNEWMPYVKGDDCLNIFGNDQVCGWVVAVNVGNDLDVPDTAPVLVSSNVDPNCLNKHRDGVIPIGTKAGRAKTAWGDEYVVVVRKSGEVDVIPADKVTMESVYGTIPSKFLKFLDVR